MSKYRRITSNKVWFLISIIFLTGSLLVPPQTGSVLEEVAPILVPNQIYRWALPILFSLSTLYWAVRIIKEKDKK